MENFGAALRKIRQAKNQTIKQAAGDIVTPAFLSKFERDESEISFSKLIPILERLNVDISEFLLEVNNFKRHPQADFLERLSLSVTDKNVDQLQKIAASENQLFLTSGNPRHQHNQLLCGLFSKKIQNLVWSETDWRPIRNYLFSVEDWVYYEFLLYANSLYFLPTETIQMLSKNAYQKGIRYIALNENKNGLTETLLNTIDVLIERGEFNSTEPYFKLCKTLIDAPDLMFERLRLHFYEGAVAYLNSDEDYGIAKMNQAVNILMTLDYEENIIHSFAEFRKKIEKSNL